MKTSFMTTAITTVVFVALLLSMLCVAPLDAQEAGSLAGNVTDPDGAAIANALVTLQKPSGTSPQRIATDALGHFEFHTVEPGVYQLTASASGFESLSRETAIFSSRVWRFLSRPLVSPAPLASNFTVNRAFNSCARLNCLSGLVAVSEYSTA